MPDNFGRMTADEAKKSGIDKVLYGGFCWKCGAPTEGGRTVCGTWFCEDKAKDAALESRGGEG